MITYLFGKIWAISYDVTKEFFKRTDKTMKKNRLFTALAAVALLAGSGVGLVENNQNVATVQAATKKGKKSSKKAASVARVRVKRGAALYQIKFNRQGTQVTKIVPLREKGRRQALRGGSFPGVWSAKYKGVKYYYIGNDGNKFWAVRARDAKVTTKKRVPTITAYVKKNVAKANAKVAARKALQKSWQAKLDAASPKIYTGKTNAKTPYFYPTSGNKFANGSLDIGTSLSIAYKTQLTGTDSNGQKHNYDVYAVAGNNNQTWYVPVQAVSLDKGSASDIPTLEQYQKSVKNYNTILAQAKKALGIKSNN